MFCGTCGSLMPEGASVCPQCHSVNVVPKSFGSESNSSADRLNGQQAQPMPATNYGAGQNPYAVPPPPPPYNMHLHPYDATARSSYTPPLQPMPAPPPYLAPQPPLQPRKRSNKLFLIIGGVLVACLALCGALVYFTSVLANSASRPGQADATPTSQSSPAAPAQPSPAAADQNPYPPQTGTLIMSDPMQNNSKGYKWDEATMNDKNGNGFCGYRQSYYHIAENAVQASTQMTIICDPEAPQLNLSNQTFEASMAVSKGTGMGLVVRFDQTRGVGYILKVFTNGQYAIGLADLNNTDANKRFNPIRTGTNAAIKQGLNQSNVLALIANGNSISAFVNGQFIDGLQDSSFTKGQQGVCAFGSGTLDVTAQNVRVWRI